jgi:hypothetical protein
MLPVFVYWMYLIILAISSLFSLLFLYKIYQNNPSTDNLYLLFCVICLKYYLGAVILFNVDLGVSFGPFQILLYKLSILCLNVSKILFVLYVLSPILSQNIRIIAHFSNFISIGIIFAIISGMVFPNLDIYRYKTVEGFTYISPSGENWLLFAFSSVMALFVIYRVLRVQINVKQYISNPADSKLTLKDFKYLKIFFITLIISSSGITIIGIFHMSPFDFVVESIFLFCLFMLLISFLSLIYYISRNTLFVLLNFNNIKELINLGLIGWVLVSNKDHGPEILKMSSNFFSSNNISESQIYKFAINTLMFAASPTDYPNSVFIIPFYTPDENLSFNLAFGLDDADIQDNRLNKKAYSVFSIIISPLFLQLLNVRKGMFMRLQRIMMENLKVSSNIDVFSRADNLLSVLEKILRELFN